MCERSAEVSSLLLVRTWSSSWFFEELHFLLAPTLIYSTFTADYRYNVGQIFIQIKQKCFWRWFSTRHLPWHWHWAVEMLLNVVFRQRGVRYAIWNLLSLQRPVRTTQINKIVTKKKGNIKENKVEIVFFQITWSYWIQNISPYNPFKANGYLVKF